MARVASGYDYMLTGRSIDGTVMHISEHLRNVTKDGEPLINAMIRELEDRGAILCSNNVVLGHYLIEEDETALSDE